MTGSRGTLRRFGAAFLLAFICTTAGGAQSALPAVTTIDALLAYPAFFHAREAVVLGQFQVSGQDQWLVSPGGTRIRVVGADASRLPAGLVEVRGDAIDLGRIPPDDPRLAGLTLDSVVERDGHAPWPHPGNMVVMRARTARRWQRPGRTTLRTVSLAPDIYDGEQVTIVGTFRGSNLYGEVPAPPARDPVEYLIRSRDAAIWVTGLPPRGEGFALNPSSRIDTGRMLEVTGTVRWQNGLTWVEGETIRLTTSEPDEEVPAVTPRPTGPPPDVQFSVPVPGELDVPLDTTVRIQFSQTMAEESFHGRVRVMYVPPQDALAADIPESPWFTTSYVYGDRLLTIQFTDPLVRFQAVRVQLVEGITSADGQPLKPWTLTFETGDR